MDGPLCECVVSFQDLELAFDPEFNIETGDSCEYDYIEVYSLGGSTPIYGPFCGSAAPDPIQFSGEILVYFHSDVSMRKGGFVAYFGEPSEGPTPVSEEGTNI